MGRRGGLGSVLFGMAMAMAQGLEAENMREPAALDSELLAEVQQIPALKHLALEDLANWQGAELIRLSPGDSLLPPNGEINTFCVMFEGEISVEKAGSAVSMAVYRGGESFGEVPLLQGWRSTNSRVFATKPSRLLRIPEDGFWKMLAASPQTREAVLADYSRRFEAYQAVALHREKLIALGTLAAGLMHELNNPGAAARRAAAQLRENLSRLQQISLRLTRTSFTADQSECLANLQEQALTIDRPVSFSTLEQSDREEELSEWLEKMKVENPWRLAPTMVSAGWTREDVYCAQSSFPPGTLSDTLNYLDALISSMQHVGTIEESITRVTDLVGAVKKYAYDDKNRQQKVDVRDSLLSTLTILNHKFRGKGIQVHRDLPPAETGIACMGAGLVQVWTNLLDNAVDAAPENGEISVRLWTEDGTVCVGIRDNGPGIPREHWERIFEPFYTTKEAGVGTGLGLDIAHRIVVGNFHGDIRFTTEPGATEFIVRLPMGDGTAAEHANCSIAAG